jgi:enoyl-CoA hydratase
MTFKNLSCDRIEAVATVTVRRPEVLNALNAATIQELDDCFLRLRDDTSVRAIVLTGEGDRAFIAGADIAELSRLTPTAAREVARRGQALCDRLERATKPVIAAVNGFALGGGLEIAMACTIRVAAETAKLGQPEVNLGLLPGFGGTQRLPRLVGPGRALEMLLTGEPVDATEAWRLGLVNRVVPAWRVLNEARELASLLASKPPLVMHYILDVVRSGMQMSLQDGCEQEATLFGLVASTEDMREGTQAFLEKRRARFKGQ